MDQQRFRQAPTCRTWESSAAAPPRGKARTLALALAFTLGAGLADAAGMEPDLTELSLEELMEIEVYTTSRYVRSLGQNPSIVSVVTGEEIKRQGYRTLADIVRSLPGLYVTNDRNYSYLGARGFGRPEDYNSRILFLVDGYRLNDNIYDSVPLGTEAILDVELIERLEFIPGPGAAILHGKNAIFGVVNIITKTGAKLDGLTLSGDVGGAGTTAGRASFGRRLDNGLDILLSASRYDRDGRNLALPELGGIAKGLDHDRVERLFAKFGYGNFVLLAAHNERAKGIPNASYGQLFNQPGSQTIDKQSLLDLSYNHPLADDSALSGRLYYGNYDFTGDYVYDADPAPYINRDIVAGEWAGAELRYVSPRLGKHKWLVGADYQVNSRQNQTNLDVDGAINLQDRRDGENWGVFFHDEYELTDRLTFNFGARFDQPTTGSSETHPRLGLVYSWTPDTTLKALYGSAFQAPNVYQRYYTDGYSYILNPNLKPETIKTQELVLEHHLGKAGKLAVTLFRYRITDLIEFISLAGLDGAVGTDDDLYTFENQGGTRAKGLELRHETQWNGGGRLRASYNWQLAETTSGLWLDNSPRHMAKLGIQQPLWTTGWDAGLEVQYLSSRRNYLGARIGAYTLVNLNLLNRRLAKDLELSARVTNLFDKNFADPASGSFDPLDRIVQDGREWSLRLEYRF
jgi:outer membrane receptor protein involved in Fe transport